MIQSVSFTSAAFKIHLGSRQMLRLLPRHIFAFYYLPLKNAEAIKILEILKKYFSYNWQKFNNKMNEKRRQECQSMDPEYVTGQINSPILELLLRKICRLTFAPSRKT